MKAGSVREGRLNLGEAEIYYQVLKRSPMLIFLHGNGTNFTAFNHQRAHFHQFGAGSLAPDQRGEGKSTYLPTPESYTLDVHTSDLERLVEAEGITKATLVGHSKGAMVAQSYAARHPDNVEALVLISASYDFGKTFGRTMLRKALVNLRTLPGPFFTAYNRMAGVVSPNTQNNSIDFSAQQFMTISDLSFVLELYSRYGHEHIRALHAITTATDKWSTESLAPKIKAPTLLIYGDADKLVPPKTAYELQEMIPGAKGISPVIIPKGQHGVHFQMPEPVIAAMEKFLVGEIYYGRLRPVSK